MNTKRIFLGGNWILGVFFSCLAAYNAGAADLKLKQSWAVSINSGEIEPATLVFGAHVNASNFYVEGANNDGFDFTFTAQPPPPGPVAPQATVYFLTQDGNFVDQEVFVATQADMRAAGDVITWQLSVDLDELPGAIITLTRTELVENDSFLTNRTMTVQGPGGFSANLLTGANLQISQSGTYVITCADQTQNTPPTAVADTAVAFKNSTNNEIDVIANDIDPDGGTLSLTGVRPDNSLAFDSPGSTSAQGGTVTIVAGKVQYTPSAGFTGTDTFQYQISDGTDTATGTVTVQVLEILAARSHAATAVIGDTLTVTLELQYNAADLYSLSVTEVLPLTGDVPPNSWQLVAGSVQTNPVSAPTVSQNGNELLIDFGTSIPDSPLTITYSVQVPPPDTTVARFVGDTTYKTSAEGTATEVEIPETFVTPQLPAEEYKIFELKNTFSFVSIPYTNSGLEDAADVLDIIINSSDLYTWNAVGQNWNGYVKGSFFPPFAVNPGGGYFVAVSAPTSALISSGVGGTWFDTSFELKEGFNLISLSQAKYNSLADKNAQALAVDISTQANCTDVYRWNPVSQSWTGHVKDSFFPPFDVAPGEVYFIFVTENGTWQ